MLANAGLTSLPSFITRVDRRGQPVPTSPSSPRRTTLPRLRISLSRYLQKGVVLAVGIRIKLPGVTQEEFDAAHDHINPDRSPWPGLLFHSSGPIDGGWGVIDFWESSADFDAHLEANIQPGIAASGVQMQGPPDIKEFPAHEIIHP
jgi:hypothetical protein